MALKLASIGIYLPHQLLAHCAPSQSLLGIPTLQGLCTGSLTCVWSLLALQGRLSSTQVFVFLRTAFADTVQP